MTEKIKYTLIIVVATLVIICSLIFTTAYNIYHTNNLIAKATTCQEQVLLANIGTAMDVRNTLRLCPGASK